MKYISLLRKLIKEIKVIASQREKNNKKRQKKSLIHLLLRQKQEVNKEKQGTIVYTINQQIPSGLRITNSSTENN